MWGKKLGIYVTYCRMIQKVLFVIFLKNHNMQERVLEKRFWNVGRSVFRVYPWSPKGEFDKVVAKASSNWVKIKNLNLEFLPFILQILKPLGSVLQVEQSRVTLPHLNGRVLLVLASEDDFPDRISLELEGEKYCWEIALLGNLNAYFHCRHNGHTKKDCSSLQPSHKEKFNVVNSKEPSGLPVTGKTSDGLVSKEIVGSVSQPKETGSLQADGPEAVQDIRHQVDKSIDVPLNNRFLWLSNLLFEEEFVVVPANAGGLELAPGPVASSLPRGQLETPKEVVNFRPVLNAQQLALISIKEKAGRIQQGSKEVLLLQPAPPFLA